MLRHRSKTNSRPHEDLAYRQRYRDANPSCELSPYMCGWVSWFGTSQPVPASEIHHIATGASGSRWDVETNLIAVGREAHDFVARSKPGFVLCCYAKWRKGEFDASVMSNICGKRLPSWLDTDVFREQCAAHPWIEKYRVELLENVCEL